MKIALAPLNYYSQNSLPKAVTAGQRLRTKRVDVVVFTEVRSEEMRAGLVAGLGSNYASSGLHKESPVFYNTKKWKKIGESTKLLTPGVSGITPNLFAVTVDLQSIKTPRKKIRVIGTHLVPLTLHGKPRTHYDERMRMWTLHAKGLSALVSDGVNRGLTVFVAGDFNRYKDSKTAVKQIHPQAKWIVRAGIDWIFRIPGPTKVLKLGVTGTVKTGSDHVAKTRQVILK